MSDHTHDELVTSFLFLTQGREVKEWLPALVTAVGGGKKWSFFHALCEQYKTVVWYGPEVAGVVERIDENDEFTTVSEERIFSDLTAASLPDSWYDTAYDYIGDIIEEYRREGLVFQKWQGERGSDVVYLHKWMGEGEWMSCQ